jgi:hypothetical protein
MTSRTRCLVFGRTLGPASPAVDCLSSASPPLWSSDPTLVVPTRRAPRSFSGGQTLKDHRVSSRQSQERISGFSPLTPESSSRYCAYGRPAPIIAAPRRAPCSQPEMQRPSLPLPLDPTALSNPAEAVRKPVDRGLKAPLCLHSDRPLPVLRSVAGSLSPRTRVHRSLPGLPARQEKCDG